MEMRNLEYVCFDVRQYYSGEIATFMVGVEVTKFVRE